MYMSCMNVCKSTYAHIDRANEKRKKKLVMPKECEKTIVKQIQSLKLIVFKVKNQLFTCKVFYISLSNMCV